MKILLPVVTSLMVTSSVAKEPETFTISANMTCDKNGHIIKIITEVYKENPFMIGLAPGEVNIVLTINEKTKTWTILAITENISCVLAMGTDLNILKGKSIKHYVVH